jgi:hypothetical protein
MNATKFRSIRNVIGSILAGFSIVNFGYLLFLDLWWTTHGPKVADPVHGFIILHRMKGHFAYFSAFQVTAVRLLPLVLFSAFFVGCLITPKKWNMVPNGRIEKFPKLVIDDLSRLWRWGVPLGIILALPIFYFIGPPFVRWLNNLGF